MNDISNEPAAATEPPKKSSRGKTILITVICTVAIIAGGLWLLNNYFFPTHFNPVELSERETTALNNKLQQVHLPALSGTTHQNLQPEAYSEANALREIDFSERELNAMLAHNTSLADKLTIDLSQDLISVKWLLPLDPEFPVLGGKTLKMTAGVEIAYRNAQPVIKLRGVSLWGVPLPDSWMGYLKNVDLVSEYSGRDAQKKSGFWRAVANGIDNIEINDGELRVKLKE